VHAVQGIQGHETTPTPASRDLIMMYSCQNRRYTGLTVKL
jgi:hypothetical protein